MNKKDDQAVMKTLAYVSIITSLMSANLLAFDLGFFQLSLFRITIIAMALGLFGETLVRGGKLRLNITKGNRFSIQFMFIWFIYGFVSLGWVKDYNNWIRALYFLGLGLLVVILYSKLFTSNREIVRGFRGMSIMIALHNLLGWYEIITGNYFFLHPDRIVGYTRGSLPVSTFGNTNDFATFLLVAIFVLYICAANSRTVVGKGAYAGLIFSSLFLLLMTNSRGNILGFLVGVTTFLYLSLLSKRGRRTMLLVALGFIMVIMVNPTALTGFISMINDKLYFNIGAYSGSDATRLNLIRNGFEFVLNTAGFGTGAGNIEHWMANRGKYYTGGITNIHNWWMEILTGYGLLVFLLYIAFYVKLFLDLYRKYKTNNDRDKTISLGAMSSMAGFLVGSMSSSSNISTEWLWMFWGLLIAYQGIEDARKKRADPET
ncbi:MAG: O-antigen ligase family protein [Firmicutes bacterium]|nr:O-antigen ligase family protein [Bacillota bacterium]